MTTLAALTQATWNVLYGVGGFERPWEDRATGAISAGALDLSALVSASGGWFENDQMEMPAGEIVFVVADTASSVNRGRDGTTAEAVAAGDPIIRSPEFPRHKVEEKILEVIRGDLKSVWSWHQDSLTFIESDYMYDLDQFVTEVVMMYQENLNADERFHPLPNGWWESERQINPAVAVNGNLLRLRRVWDRDEPVYYTAKRPAHENDLANLEDRIADMIPYAAAAKLAAGRGVQQQAHRSSEDSSKRFTDSYGNLMGEFLRMRKETADALRDEVRIEPKFVQKRRRRW